MPNEPTPSGRLTDAEVVGELGAVRVGELGQLGQVRHLEGRLGHLASFLVGVDAESSRAALHRPASRPLKTSKMAQPSSATDQSFQVPNHSRFGVPG